MAGESGETTLNIQGICVPDVKEGSAGIESCVKGYFRQELKVSRAYSRILNDGNHLKSTLVLSGLARKLSASLFADGYPLGKATLMEFQPERGFPLMVPSRAMISEDIEWGQIYCPLCQVSPCITKGNAYTYLSRLRNPLRTMSILMT